MEYHSMTKPMDRAFENYEETKKLRFGLQASFLQLAKLLHECREGRYYEDLSYKTFESYIASPELSFQRSTVFNLISIYEKFVLEYHVQLAGLLDADYTKLAEILPVVTADNYGEWLSKAISLSRSDLRDELREAGGLPEHEKSESFIKTLFRQIMATDTKEIDFDVPGGKLTVRFTSNEPTKQEFGNTQINEIVRYWQEQIGATIISQLDRRYIKNLLQNKAIKEYFGIEDDIERIKHYINEIATESTDQFFPAMASPKDAFQKFNKYTLYVNRKGNNGTKKN